jgi:hypothetical protein
MKKQVFFILLLSGVVLSAMAGTFRVNNKLTENVAAKIYTDLQAAHDAAFNGDTILVEGSPDNYSYLNCSKRLIIKGPGYFQNENPGISANKLSARTQGISFNDGSASSLLMGIEDLSYVYIYVNNITIRRCHLYNVYSQSAIENITITESYLTVLSTYYQDNSFTFSYEVTNLVIANCLINGGILITDGSTGVFLNNVMNTPYIDIPTGFDMKNNILYQTSSDNITLPSLPDPDVSNNVPTGSQFGTDNNNKASVSEEALFLGVLSTSTDGKWQLKEGSPAKAAGEGGIDCGAFGGPQPYILSGPPAGPVIYELNTSSYATEDNKLPITIKVKSY